MKRFLLRNVIPTVIVLLCGILALAYGLRLGGIVGSFAGLLVMMGAIVLAGIINGWAIADFIANVAMRLIYPTERYDRPLPAYGPARAKRKMGEYDEAILEYEKIITEYPTEVQPYIELMEIAMINLHSHQELDRIYERSMDTINDEDDQLKLTRFHKVMKEWSHKDSI